MIRLRGNVVCLDWDKRWLRLVVARVGGGAMKLEDAHAHRIPNTVDIDDPKAMGDYIAQMAARHGWKHKRVILDVPRDKAIINRLTLPPTPIHELAAVVRFQAIKELPFPLDEAVIDYAVTQRDASQRVTEVILAAVRTEVLGRLRATCAAAGLTPARIGLRPYANLMSAVHLPGMADKRVLLVDVSPTTTEIDIGQGPLLAFSRSASVNVPVRTNEPVSEESRVNLRAELEEPQPLDGGRETAVGELLVEVVRTLQAYRATETNPVIDQIIIAGSTGIESALREAVERRFGLPTMLFDPTSALGVGPGEVHKLRSFSAALGLAWGLSRDGLLELDFLNPKKPIPARAALKRRLRVGTIAASILLLAAGGYGAKTYWDRQRQLRTLQDGVAKLADQVKVLRQVRNRVDEVDEWNTQPVWLNELLALTRAAVEPGKDMLVQNMSFNRASITMKVLAKTMPIVPSFVTKINALEVGGKRPYEAAYSGWTASSGNEQLFKGSADVIVVLRELNKMLSDVEIKRRAQAREKRLKDF